jgi:transcription elongation factor Elf1
MKSNPSICPFCNHQLKLELVKEAVIGSNIPMSVIRCKDCLSVFNVLEDFSTAEIMKPIYNRLVDIEDKIDKMR